MPSVWETFGHLFTEKTATPVPAMEDVTVAGSQTRNDEIRDMRLFVGTQAYREYRKWLDREIQSHSPRPDMGSDVASCYTFKREGLIDARGRLDAMIRLAEEKLSDG